MFEFLCCVFCCWKEHCIAACRDEEKKQLKQTPNSNTAIPCLFSFHLAMSCHPFTFRDTSDLILSFSSTYIISLTYSMSSLRFLITIPRRWTLFYISTHPSIDLDRWARSPYLFCAHFFHPFVCLDLRCLCKKFYLYSACYLYEQNGKRVCNTK